MAKKSTSKKTVWYKDKILWLGLAFLVAIAGGWYYYDSHSGKASKEDFENAQADIDKVYSDIVAKLGQPANFKKSQSCSRPSQKFSQGPLSCSTGIKYIYPAKNIAEANRILSTIASSPSLSQDFKIIDSPSNTLRVSGESPPYSIYAKSKVENKATSLMCIIKSVYGTPSETYLESNLVESEIFYNSFSCSGESKQNL